MEEIISARKLNSKTFQLEGNKKAIDVSIGAIHYRDDIDNEQEQWKDIDSTIVASDRPNWDYEVVKGNWHLLIKNDTTIAIGKDGNWIGFRFDGFGYLDWETKAYEILATRNAVTPVVDGNTIRWDNIAYGTNLVYTYQNGKFKEEIEITQTARDWLVAHPPSSYGLSNANSYLGGYALCDWQNTYVAKDADGNTINWENPYESIDSVINFWHPIKDSIVSALPIGQAFHESYDDLNDLVTPIRSRFFKLGDDYRLIFGAKVTNLNSMPSGTIILDPTVDVDVASNVNDCQVYWSGSAWVFITGTDAHNVQAGWLWPVGGYYEVGSGMRFQNVAIADGADITAAYFTLKCEVSNTETVVRTRIKAEDASDTYVFSDATDFFGRVRTSTVLDWDSIPAWTINNFYNSPSIITIIQELVDSYDYSGGTHSIVLFWDDFDKRSTQNTLRRRAGRSYQGDSSNPPALHIEYTAGFAHSQGIMI